MADFKTEATKKIQIVTTEADHQFLKALADEAGITQGLVLHLLLEGLQMLVGVAHESGLVDLDARVSAAETFTLMVLFHSGLLGDAELTRAVTLADVMNGMDIGLITKRLAGMEQLANERLEQLRPIWEAARAERAASKVVEWDAAKAAAKAMVEAIE